LDRIFQCAHFVFQTLTAEGIWDILDYKFIPFGNAYYNEGMDELGCPGSKFYNRNEGTPCWQTNCGDVNFQPEECFAGMILWLIHVIVFNIGITAVFFLDPNEQEILCVNMELQSALEIVTRRVLRLVCQTQFLRIKQRCMFTVLRFVRCPVCACVLVDSNSTLLCLN
jgi:hypothetical protein